MVVKNQSDEAYVNNPHTQRFTVVDEDTGPSTPLDLTNRVVKWGLSQIDPATGLFLTTPLVFEKSSLVGGEMTRVDDPNGIIEVNILDADTISVNPADYYFELEVFDSGGLNGVVVATGTLTLIGNLVNA
jgi:hypothetical protein